MKLKGKRVVILGFGISGRAAARFLVSQGAKVTAIDDRAESLEKEPGVCFKSALQDDDEILIVSPGIPPSHILYREAKSRQIPVWGETELACRYLKQRAIAITGTNGKTTVTKLIAHVLNDQGIPAAALGNIGIPLAGYQPAGDEVAVVELSSYQLETMETAAFDIGVVLNITLDHIERYGSQEAYTQAKMRLRSCLKPGAPFYVHPQLLLHGGRSYITEEFGWESPFTFEQENLCAAFQCVSFFGVGSSQFLQSVQTFQKPPHRLEFVGEVEGVSYYNDSKGTNIDAVIKAVMALPGKIHLIAGGMDKGGSYAPWISEFSGKVATIALIGEAADKIEQQLAGHFSIEKCGTLEKAFSYCRMQACSGETILLSPGCSSFDQYRNFEQRGEEFRRLIPKQLQNLGFSQNQNPKF